MCFWFLKLLLGHFVLRTSLCNLLFVYLNVLFIRLVKSWWSHYSPLSSMCSSWVGIIGFFFIQVTFTFFQHHHTVLPETINWLESIWKVSNASLLLKEVNFILILLRHIFTCRQLMEAIWQIVLSQEYSFILFLLIDIFEFLINNIL